MSSLIVTRIVRVVVFCEIFPFLHELHVNVKQGECVADMSRADGLPLLPHDLLISLRKGRHSLWIIVLQLVQIRNSQIRLLDVFFTVVTNCSRNHLMKMRIKWCQYVLLNQLLDSIYPSVSGL